MKQLSSGGYNVIKMLIVTIDRKRDVLEGGGGNKMVTGYFFILFFIVNYGFFVFVQTAIFAGVSGQFVVILGRMFLAFEAGKFFMLIFVVIKIYAEIFMNFYRY